MTTVKDNRTQFEKIWESVSAEQVNNRDLEIPFQEIRMTDEGFLVSSAKLGTHKGSRLTDYALTQLLTKAEMPVSYMKRMLEREPQLVAEHFNYLMAQKQYDEKQKTALLRGRLTEEGLVVRGVLSDKYTIMDNHTIMDSLVGVANQMPDFSVESVHNSDKKLHLRLSFNDLQRDFGVSPEGKRDIIKVGLDIQNSEVGFSSLVIAPITYRLVCTNGLKMWAKEEGALKQRHVHVAASELQEMMVCSIDTAIAKGKELLDGMAVAQKVTIENPYEFIEMQSQMINLSNKMITTVKSNFDIEPEKNLFGIVNAFTRTARDVKNHEQRLAIESHASRIMRTA